MPLRCLRPRSKLRRAIESSVNLLDPAGKLGTRFIVVANSSDVAIVPVAEILSNPAPFSRYVNSDPSYHFHRQRVNPRLTVPAEYGSMQFPLS